MPPTTPPATPSAPDPGRPRAGAPRWAWVLIAVLAAVAIVAVTVAVTGRDSDDDNTAATPPVPTGQAGQAADGCLGGPGDSLARGLDLDRAMLDAQLDAPLTAEGAAAFTATLIRWTLASPLPPDKEATAEQILTADATTDARRSAGLTDPQGTTSRADFADGRYYVESFDGQTAIVSWATSGFVTERDGTPGVVTIGGSAHLLAVDGMWRFKDQSLARPLAEIQRLGTRYAGGC